ncbi:MAG: TIGR02996 domain-containing protein [Kofleriaceae bacterium]
MITDAIHAGDYERALALLLDAWRATSSPKIAIAIDQVTVRISRPKPAGKTIDAKQRAWLALADANEPAAVGTLLATFADVKRAEIIEARLERLASYPRDPRIAMALVQLVGNWPVPGETGLPSLRRALELVIRIADPRTRQPIIDLHLSGGNATTRFVKGQQHRIAAELASAITTSPPPAEIDDVIEALSSPETAATADTLYDAVYTDPDNDQPRQVLADFLQTQGDPRGAFIAMQLAGKKTKAYDRAWLGPLEPALHKTGTAFERGFLARARIKRPQSAFDQILAAREWSTVTALDIADWSPIAVGARKRFPALRKLYGVASAIPHHPTLELVTISAIWHDNLTVFDDVRAPALRSIVVEDTHGSFEQFTSLWKKPLLEQLDRLWIDVWNLEAWIPAAPRFLKPRGPLASLTLSMRKHSPWLLLFEGERVTIGFDHVRWKDPDDPGHQLNEVLALIPRNLEVVRE